MAAQKFQIFVSSTYSDLAAIRRSVMDAIQKMNQFPVGMEQFSADDDEQWQIIQETIQQSDYYICILGHRYGSISPDGRSFTEREWDFAKELGIPIMSFVRERDVPTTPWERESSNKANAKLETFIEKAKGDKMVDFWKQSADLESKIVTALFKAFQRKPRPGWIRTESGKIAEELAAFAEENRNLRRQVEELTAQITKSAPAMQVLINNDSTVALEIFPDQRLQLKATPKIEPISESEIPAELLPYLTNGEISEYNRSIPDARELEDTFSQIRLLQRLQANQSPLVWAIHNTGTAKAREVYIEISCPEWFVFMEKEDLEKMNYPEIKISENPLERARKKFDDAQRPKRGRSIMDMFTQPYGTASFVSDFKIDHFHSPLLELHNPGYSCYVKDKKVLIWIRDLMHTRKLEFDEVVGIPMRSGDGVFDVTVICEEMRSQQCLQIPFSVKDSRY